MIEDEMFIISVPLDENYSADYQIRAISAATENPSLTQRQNAIITLMRQIPTITAVQLAENLDVSSRTIENEIKQLRKSGIIERQGATKDGRWIVKTEK